MNFTSQGADAVGLATRISVAEATGALAAAELYIRVHLVAS